MTTQRSFYHTAFILLLVFGLGGCAAFTLPEPEIASMNQVAKDHVLVVGKIQVTPGLRPKEKELSIPNDVFGMGKLLRNRAILMFDQDPSTQVKKGDTMINPRLDETFFFAVPREQLHMIGGYVMLSYSITNGIVTEQKMRIPGGLELSVSDDDQAVYIGTLQLQRDAFNSVVDAGIADEYAEALAAFNERFGSDMPLSKVLPVTPVESSDSPVSASI